jgi:uncharacterized protein (DUF2235 family)
MPTWRCARIARDADEGVRGRMPKNIVICCDGTSNEFDGDRTNVVKLYQMLNHDPAVQATYYHPGLGTMEAAGALTGFSRWWTKAAGFAFGYGLKNDIRDAYVFLMNNYEKGDKVFLFGFSRGAYTVRAVASLLHMVGLIRPGNEPLVPYAIRMMTKIKEAEHDDARDAITRTMVLAQQFKLTFSSVACRANFVGVWDTVNSVGWVENPLRLPFSANNPSIDVGRHAVAIDERRAFFRENLWRPRTRKPSGPRDTMQVWFPGSHGDIGGGYPERDSGLSKVALEWMLREAQAEGLLTVHDREDRIMGEAGGNYVKPDPTADIHDELRHPVWWPAQLFPKKRWERRIVGEKEVWIQRRRMSLSGHRKIPKGAYIHESAYERDEDYVANLPPDAIRIATMRPPQDDKRHSREKKKISA